MSILFVYVYACAHVCVCLARSTVSIFFLGIMTLQTGKISTKDFEKSIYLIMMLSQKFC